MEIVRIQENGSGLHCPFCGKKFFDFEALGDGEPAAVSAEDAAGNPCEHVVFIGVDGAGDELEELMPYIAEEDRPEIEEIYAALKGDGVEFGDELGIGFEEFVLSIDTPGSVCFWLESDSAFMGSPEGAIGFAQREG